MMTKREQREANYRRRIAYERRLVRHLGLLEPGMEFARNRFLRERSRLVVEQKLDR